MSAYTLLSGHPASDHQAAIFDVMADPRSGSKIIKAVAGAGKTTVIKNALRFLPAGCHVQGFAFNTDAAQNLKDALAEVAAECGAPHTQNVRMGTFHSVGFYAVTRHLRLSRKVEPDSGKSRKILKEKLTETEFDLYGGFCADLVSLAKGEGIGALVADTEDRWYDLIDHHGLTLDSEDATEARAVEVARKLLALGTKRAETGVIDYDDMLYLVVRWKLRLWRNDVVFVDECQDVNPVREAIASLALKPGGRLFAVGDPRQSIYGFTGASVDAMDKIAARFRTTELPLTVSYRCARAVVEDAQNWVDYILPSKHAEEGEVARDVPVVAALRRLTQEDAVLCRQTAPLIDLAYKLIAAGRACRVRGRDIAEGLLNLIRAQKARGIDRLVEKLASWAEREIAKFEAKGEEARAVAVADKRDCLTVLINSLPETERTIPALERRIIELFRLDEGDDVPVLTLCTVHKAKGQEWSSVAILRPDLMPGFSRSDWAAVQEENLQYVAATRAKTLLMYLNPNDNPTVDAIWSDLKRKVV